MIRKIERLKDDPQTLEAAFQSLISEALANQSAVVAPDGKPILHDVKVGISEILQKEDRQRSGVGCLC